MDDGDLVSLYVSSKDLEVPQKQNKSKSYAQIRTIAIRI